MATELQFIKSASGTSVSSLSVTDCFSADYDVYYVSATKIDISTSGYYNHIRVINSGGVDSGSNYDYAAEQVYSYSAFAERRATNQTSWFYSSWQSNAVSDGVGLGMYIFNPYDSSSYTFMLNQSSGFNTSNGLIGLKGIGVHHTAEQITGINIFSIYNYDNVTLNVYGVK